MVRNVIDRRSKNHIRRFEKKKNTIKHARKCKNECQIV